VIARQLFKYLPPFSVTFLLLIVLFLKCSWFNAQSVPDHIVNLVESVQAIHAPDSRVQLFEIEVNRMKDEITISGQVTDAVLREVLFDSLRRVADDFNLIDSIQLLPLADMQPDIYGIITISVANMRSKPSFTAELVNQALLGAIVELYKEEDDFFYARNWDQYLGWISGASIVRVDSLAALSWRRAPRVICTSNYGLVRERPDSEADAIVDLVAGAVLKVMDSTGEWLKVEIPDGRAGYVEWELVMDESEFRQIPAGRDRIITVASHYLGIPYLWGGASTKGFDCSGLVQTVFRMSNTPLPRDASQIVLMGEPVEWDDQFENVLTGDLLFFGEEPDKVTHVAIYLGNRQFIHSSGFVHIKSLDPASPLYDEDRHETFQTVRRILPD